MNRVCEVPPRLVPGLIAEGGPKITGPVWAIDIDVDKFAQLLLA
jgi:hypothetical protein